jgi:ABC-2 type transport system ATP-binding protein
MKILKIEKLNKKFADVAAVDGISLEIDEGEIFGLLGPNGAGKSTVINIICGLLDPDAGSVEFLGRDIKKNPAQAKRNIGMVPQDIAIYEDLTAYENVAFFASLYGLRGSQLKERAWEALAFTGLADKAGSFPSGFSGGMKRRLNIACAIAHRPRLIIMDEPTVGIDPQSRNHILQSVRKLNEMGSTIIYTSHYMEEVEEICTGIAIVDHGKVIAEGTREELTAIVTDARSVSITLDSTAGVSVEHLRAMAGVLSVEKEGDRVTVNSSTDVNNLDKIILYFTGRDIPIKNIEAKTPDLETVFLALTGRKLRD